MGVFGTASKLASFSVAVAVLVSCGGKSDEDDATPRETAGGRETTGGTPGNGEEDLGGRPTGSPLGGVSGGARETTGSGGSSGRGPDTPVRGGGPGEPDPEQPFSDPIPVGEVPPCIEDAPPLLEGYTYHALYRFEEPRGATVEDTIGIGQGTFQGASRGEGECGRGISFNVDGAHVELSNLGDVFQDGIAVGLWVRPTSEISGEAHLVGDGPWGLTTFQLYLDDGAPALRLAGPNGDWRDLLRASEPLEIGAWQYVQAAYDLDAAQLFVDGREVATSSLIYAIPGSYNTLYVGATASLEPGQPFERSFVGDLDEIALYAADPP